jgi:DNA-binding beta-propeller fold protein YncE
VGVKITIDQSVIGLPWDEIDAVELVGLVESVVEVSGGASGQDSGDTPPAEPPAGDLVMPEDLLWRVSEDSLGIELGTFGDMAVSEDGRLYVPDNRVGVLVFDTDGNLIDQIEHEELQNPVDVKIGPDGNLYIADYFADGVLIFTQEGEFLSRFGESGNGPGQFGSFGPKSLAVGPDNTVYTIDDNRDEDDNPFMRLMMFTKTGEYLGETPIDLDTLFPIGMDFGPDGYLYIVNYRGNNLQKWDAEGNYVADVGSEALERSDPQYVAFDEAGYMYLTIWEAPGVTVLDPAGNFLGHFGFEEDPGVSPWPQGAMNKPTGIAVTADGAQVFFCDYANSQPILESLELK